MRILFLSDNFPPEVNAPATRTYEHCRQWAEAGHQVTVVTCNPNFPEGKLVAGYRNRLLPRRETVDGIEVVRVWSYITANQGFARRVIDYLSFAVAAFLAGLFRPCDVIVATSPQFFTTWSAWGLARVKRRPWVFEVRDLWPASIAAVGAIRQARLLRWLERIELALYRSTARIIVVTEAFRDDLVRRGIPADKIGVVTNGANLERFSPRPRDTELEQRLGLQGKTVVAYIGTHGMAHGLDFIVECAAAVTDPKLHFIFIGAGAQREQVIERAKALGVGNCTFLEPVPRDEIARYIATCDIMLVPLRKSELFRTVIPSKIFEAAAMERPILLGVDGEARAIVERFGAGRYFEPENQPGFLAALQRMWPGSDAYRQMQRACQALAAAYDRKTLAATMLQELEIAARS